MTRYCVEFDWRRVGTVKLDTTGALKFPVVPKAPGLYQFWIEDGEVRPQAYIGEASEFTQRWQRCKTPGVPKPGKNPTTNQRLNAILKDAIAKGSKVSVFISTEASPKIDDGAPIDVPMSRKNTRLIVEQTAIHAVQMQNIGDDDAVLIVPVVLDRPGRGEDEYG
jgi:hypothetical protein